MLKYFPFLLLVSDRWGDLRRSIEMGILDKIPNNASRLAKPREPLAYEGANTSEQVANAAATTAEALITEAVEKNTAGEEVIEKNTAEEAVVEKDEVGKARQSKRSSKNKAVETKASQKARLEEAQNKGKDVALPIDKKKEKEEAHKKAEVDLKVGRVPKSQIGDTPKIPPKDPFAAQRLDARALLPPASGLPRRGRQKTGSRLPKE